MQITISKLTSIWIPRKTPSNIVIEYVHPAASVHGSSSQNTGDVPITSLRMGNNGRVAHNFNYAKVIHIKIRSSRHWCPPIRKSSGHIKEFTGVAITRHASLPADIENCLPIASSNSGTSQGATDVPITAIWVFQHCNVADNLDPT